MSLKPSSSSTDTNFITTSTQSSPVPASQICLSCQSADTKRNSNLVEVVDNMENFMSSFHNDIESVKGNLADLNNYIVKLDDIEDVFTRVEDKLTKSTELEVKIKSELTKIDEMEKFIHTKLDHIDSFTNLNSKDTENTVLQKLLT